MPNMFAHRSGWGGRPFQGNLNAGGQGSTKYPRENSGKRRRVWGSFNTNQLKTAGQGTIPGGGWAAIGTANKVMGRPAPAGGRGDIERTMSRLGGMW